MPRLDRRRFLLAAGSIALLGGVSRMPLSAQGLGVNPFALGVASGDPWPDGFVIWTRLAPKPLEEHGGMPSVRVPVRWEVAEDDRFSKVVRRGETVALPELAHSVHVEVGGLKPHRRYWYRFATMGSELSNVGTAMTAPATDALVQRLRIGVAGCDHYEAGYFGAWQHLAKEPELDLVFHYGDYIYEGSASPLGARPGGWNVVRQHVGGEIYSIDDYRRRYAQYKSDPALIAAHAASAFAVSFDDHEIDNNWASAYDQDGTPPEIFALRKLAALQAWYEHMPVRRTQFPTAGGVVAYRRLDFGRLLRMHVLDTRSYRSDQPCGDDAAKNPCPPAAHSAPDMLGKVQEAWLDEGLGNDATWNLLAQQVIVMPVDFRRPGADEARFATDLWDGYRPARARLVETIKKHRLTNVVIASGDHHRALVGEVPENDEALDGRKVAVEFEASSITSEGNGRGEAEVGYMAANNPHFAFYTDRRGYQMFEITPKQWTAEVKLMDQVEKPGGKIGTQARFVVTPDASRLHRA